MTTLCYSGYGIAECNFFLESRNGSSVDGDGSSVPKEPCATFRWIFKIKDCQCKNGFQILQQGFEKESSGNSFPITKIRHIFKSISVISQEYVVSSSSCACNSEISILSMSFLFHKLYSFIRLSYLSVLASYNLSIARICRFISSNCSFLGGIIVTISVYETVNIVLHCNNKISDSSLSILSGIISYNNYFNKCNQFLELSGGFLFSFTLTDYCSSSNSTGNIFHSF